MYLRYSPTLPSQVSSGTHLALLLDLQFDTVSLFGLWFHYGGGLLLTLPLSVADLNFPLLLIRVGGLLLDGLGRLQFLGLLLLLLLLRRVGLALLLLLVLLGLGFPVGLLLLLVLHRRSLPLLARRRPLPPLSAVVVALPARLPFRGVVKFMFYSA